ncbi:hypothetical protein E2562_030358 [Oryza meyeriana var. granulata]|uniref:Uncharacterized protein n=1 Tax=Oryza meyeriana var. granulata TaxID=110450 RepID=A0A6G1DSA9_9ORYZ|nr:hypothetical protein E2562_030358 [Oryza meyeriana var. granulata]
MTSRVGASDRGEGGGGARAGGQGRGGRVRVMRRKREGGYVWCKTTTTTDAQAWTVTTADACKLCSTKRGKETRRAGGAVPVEEKEERWRPHRDRETTLLVSAGDRRSSVEK